MKPMSLSQRAIALAGIDKVLRAAGAHDWSAEAIEAHKRAELAKAPPANFWWKANEKLSGLLPVALSAQAFLAMSPLLLLPENTNPVLALFLGGWQAGLPSSCSSGAASSPQREGRRNGTRTHYYPTRATGAFNADCSRIFRRRQVRLWSASRALIRTSALRSKCWSKKDIIWTRSSTRSSKTKKHLSLCGTPTETRSRHRSEVTPPILGGFFIPQVLPLRRVRLFGFCSLGALHAPPLF